MSQNMQIKDIVKFSDYVEDLIIGIDDGIKCLERMRRGNKYEFAIEELKKQKKMYEEKLTKFYNSNISEIGNGHNCVNMISIDEIINIYK